jgi:hypothetical protein
MKLLTTLAGGVLAAGAAQALPTPDHIYEFSGSFADLRGGPAATNNGGSFTGSGATAGLTFGANQGPTLTNVFANPASYSIEMFFELDFTAGYRKVIDFKNRATHNGLYVNSGTLSLYGTSGSGGTVAPNSFAHLVLTRDAVSKQVVAYLNGVQAFSLTDSGSVATFSTANGAAHFLRDDGLGGGGENSPGTVDFIRTYNQVLGASDVAELYNRGTPVRSFAGAVPEPATWAMMIGGFGLAGAAARRRRPAAVLA